MGADRRRVRLPTHPTGLPGPALASPSPLPPTLLSRPQARLPADWQALGSGSERFVFPWVGKLPQHPYGSKTLRNAKTTDGTGEWRVSGKQHTRSEQRWGEGQIQSRERRKWSLLPETLTRKTEQQQPCSVLPDPSKTLVSWDLAGYRAPGER